MARRALYLATYSAVEQRVELWLQLGHLFDERIHWSGLECVVVLFKLQIQQAEDAYFFIEILGVFAHEYNVHVVWNEKNCYFQINIRNSSRILDKVMYFV